MAEMIDTVRFRPYGGYGAQFVDTEFKNWALSNLDDGEYVCAYDIANDAVLFQLLPGDSDDGRLRRWCPVSKQELL